MLLLTWLGTILRLEKRTSRLTHSSLVPHRSLAADVAVDLPAEGLTGPLAGPGGMTLQPSGQPGRIHLMRDGQYLFISHRAYPSFTDVPPREWESLLLVSEPGVAALRDLLSHGWTDAGTGDAVPVRLGHGPVLHLGSARLDLSSGLPITSPDDPAIIHAGPHTLRRIPGSRVTPSELTVAPANPARIPDVPDEAAFQAAATARYTIPAPSEIAVPPLILDTASRDFLYRRAWKALPPEFGRIQRNSQVLRARNKFVLLERRVEGMILDDTGVLNEAGYIGNLDGMEPPYFGREGDRYFLDRRLFETAVPLAGRHAVFYGGNYQNYYHWLIDALVPLSLMAPYLPPGTALLLPGSLDRFRAEPVGKLDYIEALEAFGFGAMPRAEIPGQICRVEEIFWPDRCDIQNQPAAALLAARDRALSHAQAASSQALQSSDHRAPSRIYIRRHGSRGLADESAIETVLRRNSLVPVLMEDLTVTQQIDLFRRAEIVVAPHGAGLANVLFCPPGTKVLELSPDCEYRPFFNQMAAKLGLSHAVLPCRTDDGTFNGRLDPDPKRLQRLLNLLLSRQSRVDAA